MNTTRTKDGTQSSNPAFIILSAILMVLAMVALSACNQEGGSPPANNGGDTTQSQ